ncbi:hypothetical protein [[Limnothrix rosea] IAM M-220]|uniref:hypothetical protein n=1 Tax=[Limnothrix rosea] IAM M-220 TaxID=454133 RepID=UPI0009648B88|nr:hypothetical protein [[Limnothrix rosea] IAM M-220]OKH17602.1 hypothetical protein NIES208_08820 [[Limnothrix rosea] IAM M-220]
MGKFWKIGRSPWLSVLLGSLSAFVTAQGAIAQDENLPICPSPAANEFLVLVFTPSQPLREEVRLQVGRTLSKDHHLLVCQYGGNILSRVGNFTSQARATQWAEYFDNAVGLPLMVITPVTTMANTPVEPPVIPTLLGAADPPEVVVPTEGVVAPDVFQGRIKPDRTIPVGTLSAELAPTSESVERFEPQALTGDGYGILVDYGVNPAIATELKALLAQDIDLVTHGTRGYLLVEQTTDENRLIEVLNLLSQNNFTAIAIPTEQIIRLKANILP